MLEYVMVAGMLLVMEPGCLGDLGFVQGQTITVDAVQPITKCNMAKQNPTSAQDEWGG